MTAPLLEVTNLSAGYGAVQALAGVSLHVDRGEVVTLIGANGAGKSTLLMTVCGDPPARAGSVRLDGEEISGLPTHAIMRRGIAQAPEGRRIFARMTVLENLVMGAESLTKEDPGPRMEQVFALFPRLRERLSQRGGTLSGGEQQMLAIGRALMSNPRLLLLDEPSLGLAPLMVRQIFAAIRRLNRETGLTVLLVEQNANLALRLADRGYVLVTGRITMEGTGAELLARREIRDAYLGETAKAGAAGRG
jgi:branched-chain amino acid transport system ATP-binding protein